MKLFIYMFSFVVSSRHFLFFFVPLRLEKNTLKETQAIFEKLFLDSSEFTISGTIFDPESGHIIPFSHCDNCHCLRPPGFMPPPPVMIGVHFVHWD